MILWGGGLDGPTVVPGEYQVRLTVGGKSQTRKFEVRKDPRLSTTTEDYQKRFDLHQKIRDKLTETHDAITKLRDVRDQLDAVAKRSKQVAEKDTTIATAAKALSKDLTNVEESLYQTKNKSSQDPLNYPIRLNNKLSDLTDVVNSADAPPTAQTYAVYDEIAGKIDVELASSRHCSASGLLISTGGARQGHPGGGGEGEEDRRRRTEERAFGERLRKRTSPGRLSPPSVSVRSSSPRRGRRRAGCRSRALGRPAGRHESSWWPAGRSSSTSVCTRRPCTSYSASDTAPARGSV